MLRYIPKNQCCSKCRKNTEHLYKDNNTYICGDCLIESEKKYKAKKENNGYFSEKET